MTEKILPQDQHHTNPNIKNYHDLEDNHEKTTNIHPQSKILRKVEFQKQF